MSRDNLLYRDEPRDRSQYRHAAIRRPERPDRWLFKVTPGQGERAIGKSRITIQAKRIARTLLALDPPTTRTPEPPKP